MRRLDWHGYRNARDLGGLPTPMSPTGATIPARVARGPRRELLTDDGWQDAKRWGLATVVDLRCEYEIGARDGDPAIASGAAAGVTVVRAPTEDQEDAEFQATCFPILDSPEYWRHNWRILPGLVRATLEAVAAAEPGVLVHCSAGRDRTGMISALLLGNAGVPPRIVADDWAESVRAMAGSPHNTPTQDRQSTWSQAEVESWIAEKSPIVEGVAADAPAVFESLEVDAAVSRRLRELLTDPE